MHRFLAYVVIGSILVHIAVKLPDIKYGLSSKVADGDVLTEIPWDENPDSHSNVGLKEPPQPTGLSRRGVLTAAGAGIGVVVITSVGQTVTPLAPVGLLAIRQSEEGPAESTDQPHCGAGQGEDGDCGRLEVEGARPEAVCADPGRRRGDGRARGAFPDLLRGGVERRRAVARPSPARRGRPAPAAIPGRASR